MVTVPTSLATSVLANVGSTLTDPGTLAVVGIAIGVPFAFYFIKRLIGMLPKGK